MGGSPAISRDNEKTTPNKNGHVDVDNYLSFNNRFNLILATKIQQAAACLTYPSGRAFSLIIMYRSVCQRQSFLTVSVGWIMYSYAGKKHLLEYSVRFNKWVIL